VVAVGNKRRRNPFRESIHEAPIADQKTFPLSQLSVTRRDDDAVRCFCFRHNLVLAGTEAQDCCEPPSAIILAHRYIDVDGVSRVSLVNGATIGEEAAITDRLKDNSKRLCGHVTAAIIRLEVGMTKTYRRCFTYVARCPNCTDHGEAHGAARVDSWSA